MATDPEYATVKEVSAYLGVTPNALYGWRRHGKGPRSTRVCGALRYEWPDVEAWIIEQTARGRGPVGAAARVVAARGMPTPVRSLVRSEVIVPPHTWTFVPGTRLQVHHEANHLSWCELHKDGSLTVGDPYDRWSTRMAPDSL